MKARVKETREIIDVIPFNRDGFAYIQDDGETVYEFHELEILDEPDYWTRLEHQYAGMAMQGMLSNTTLITVLFDATKDHDELLKEVIICSHEYAHALVEKLKSESNG